MASASTTSSGDKNGNQRLLRGGAPTTARTNEKAPLLPLQTSATHARALPLASDGKTFASAIIAFLGSGVLGFPYAFKQTGISLGIALLLFVAGLTAFCMQLVIECKYRILRKHRRTVTTYGEIGQEVFGWLGRWLVNVFLVASQAGFVVAYLLFISVNVHDYFGISQQLVVLLCLPPLIVFALLRHIKHLAWVAVIADLMNFVGLAVVFVSYFTYIHDNSSERKVHTETIKWGGVSATIPFFFGVATYAFAGVGLALPLENAMEHKKHFGKVLFQTVALIATLYGTFGVFGYLAFGDETKDVVTLNIDGHGSLSTIAKLSLCIALLCSCPVMLFPVFEVLQPACLSPLRLHDISLHKERLIVLAVRTLVILAIAAIAGAAPSFGGYISFVGSTCCSILGFVLPVIFHLRLFGDSHSAANKWFLRFVLLIGLFAVGAGFYTAGKSILF